MAGYTGGFTGLPGSQKDDGGIGLGDVLAAPLHFTEHLAEDVGKATIGFVPGIYHLLTDPVASTEAIAKGIAADWAPLVTGHPLEFAEHFYNHPLGPILDVAALFTGGAAAAGRVARTVSAASYGTRAAETITRGGKLVSDAGRLDEVAKAEGPVTLDSVLDASEPVYSPTTQIERMTTRAGATRPGERVIVEGGRKPGQFAKAIENPSRVDRLAAYSREGSRTLYRYDTVGAKGRINVGSEARFPIPYQTGSGVAQKLRAEQVDKLMQNFASRGGTLGAIPQWSYEMQAIGRLGGSIAALGWQLGQAEKVLEKVYDKTNGQMKHTGMKEIAHDWWDRTITHAVQTGRYEEVGKNVSRVSYMPVAKRSSITRSITHYHKGGEVTKRGFGMGGVDMAVKDLTQLGRRIANRQHAETFTGKDLIEKWGADATKVVPTKKYHVYADRHTLRNLGADSAASTNMLLKGFYRGTSLWKTIILGYSPRFFFNNMVGNGLMFSMNYMGTGALFGVRHAIRQLHGERAMRKADMTMEDAVAFMSKQNWMQSHFANQLGSSLHHSSLPEKVAAGAKGTALHQPGYKAGGKLERGAQHTFGFTGKYAERAYRMAAVAIEVRADARVAAAQKRIHAADKSLSREEVFNRAAAEVLDKHPDLARTVNQKVDEVMGNYTALTKPERALRNISPFYTWQRHIIKNSVHMALDKPIRTDLFREIGNQGSDAAAQAFGGVIPSFGQGLVPLGDEKLSTGGVNRMPVWATAGFNPWAQVGELARAGEATLGVASGGDVPRPGETVGSLLNPLAVAGVEALSGSNLLSGSPMTAREALLSPVTGLPHYTWLKSVVAPDHFSQPTLYAKTPQEQFMALLGLNKKDLYLARLRQLGVDEQKGG